METNFDFSKLKGRIVEKYDSCTKFAEALGWHKSYLSAKLKGKVGFTASDIKQFSDLLGLETEDIGIYFFTVKV